MSHQKIAIIIFGYLIGGLCVFGRLMMSGWLFLLGITSIMIFGIMHLAFMLDINKYYDDLLKSDKIIAWTGVLTFPFIFLFQFDFGDQPGLPAHEVGSGPRGLPSDTTEPVTHDMGDRLGVCPRALGYVNEPGRPPPGDPAEDR